LRVGRAEEWADGPNLFIRDDRDVRDVMREADLVLAPPANPATA
jgi:hypothetical protein